MILTNEILKQGKSDNGGWSLNQLRCFGISKFQKGWQRKVIGRNFSNKTITRFLALKNVHLTVKKIFDGKSEFDRVTENL